MAKLQAYRAYFENVKMNEDEDVASFFLKVVFSQFSVLNFFH